ncbi:MAG: hypothetical protein C4293_18250 [Nitrospiraceae bacterium]
MSLSSRLTVLARSVKRELRLYQLLLEEPRVPKLAKWLIGLALAYRLSPIDLIPDFLPGIGYLDDAMIVPILVMLAFKLIPNAVVEENRSRARGELNQGSHGD